MAIPLSLIRTREYRSIRLHYGDQKAQRSGVPLMNHINEGLKIMVSLKATPFAMRAFALHPIFQSDDALKANAELASEFHPYVVLLTMEYRKCANAYLCLPHTDSWGQKELALYVGPLLPEVRHMLIADKRQNKKDFLTYHHATHPRAEQLLAYFNQWLVYLGDTEHAGR